MTSAETCLNVNIDHSAKTISKHKLTDMATPHRSRKKTKTKTRDRSLSSMRDRMYNDPAYTDDISHLAKPLRRSSCFAKTYENKVKAQTLNSANELPSLTSAGMAVVVAATAATATATTHIRTDMGSFSLDRQRKIAQDLRSIKKHNAKSQQLATDLIYDVAYGSSEENLADVLTQHFNQIHSAFAVDWEHMDNKQNLKRRGRSLERLIDGESSERKFNKFVHETKHNMKQATHVIDDGERHYHTTGQRGKKTINTTNKMPKQFSDETQQMSRCSAENDDVTSKKRTSVSMGTSKMQLGRRILKGEIGIKSFNYYLLKEGLKSTKNYEEKQQTQCQTKNQLQTRSEENIYEELFFHDSSLSAENMRQQQQQELLITPALNMPT